MTEAKSPPVWPIGCFGLALLIVAVLGVALGLSWRSAQEPAKPESPRIPAGTAAEATACSEPTAGSFYVVTDAASPYDCATGGGRWTLVCLCNGQSYVPLYRGGAR